MSDRKVHFLVDNFQTPVFALVESLCRTVEIYHTTRDKEEVTCKNCLKIIKKHEVLNE